MRKLFVMLQLVIFIISNDGMHATTFIPDTIDFNSRRYFFIVPEWSFENSIKACDGHGCVYYFPLTENNEGLFFANLVMTEFELKESREYDIELWNSFNGHNEGSRAYIRNNAYYRIDQYKDGTVIGYSQLSCQTAQIANVIMDSVKVKRKNIDDAELKANKRKKGVLR